jgi:hypothetical protein
MPVYSLRLLTFAFAAALTLTLDVSRLTFVDAVSQ